MSTLTLALIPVNNPIPSSSPPSKDVKVKTTSDFSSSPPVVVPQSAFSNLHFTPREISAITASFEQCAEISTSPVDATSLSRSRKRVKRISDAKITNATLRGTQSETFSFYLSDKILFKTVAEHQAEAFEMSATIHRQPLTPTSAYNVVKKEQSTSSTSSKSYIVPQTARTSTQPCPKESDKNRLSLETPFLNACLVHSKAFDNLDPRFKIAATPRRVVKPAQYNRRLQALTMLPFEIKKLQNELLIQEENKPPTDNPYHYALVKLYYGLKASDPVYHYTYTEEEKKKGNLLFRTFKNLLSSKKKNTENLQSLDLTHTIAKEVPNSKKSKILVPIDGNIMTSQPLSSKKKKIKRATRNSKKELSSSAENKPVEKAFDVRRNHELRRIREIKEVSMLNPLFNPKDDIIELDEALIKLFHNQRAVVEDHLKVESHLVIKYPIPTQFTAEKDLQTIAQFQTLLLQTYKSREHVLADYFENFTPEESLEEIVKIICGQYHTCIIDVNLKQFSESSYFSKTLEKLFSVKTRKLVYEKLESINRNSPRIKITLLNETYEVFKIASVYACALLLKTLIFQSTESILNAVSEGVELNHSNISITEGVETEKLIDFREILNLFFEVPLHFYCLKINPQRLSQFRLLHVVKHFKKRKAELNKLIDPELITKLTKGNPAENEKAVFSVFGQVIQLHQKKLIEAASPVYCKLRQHNDLEKIHFQILSLFAFEELKDPEKLRRYSTNFIQVIRSFFNKDETAAPHPIAQKLITFIKDDNKILHRLNEIRKLHEQLQKFIPPTPVPISPTAMHDTMSMVLANPEALCVFDGEAYVDAFNRIAKCYNFFTLYKDTIAQLENCLQWEGLIKTLPKEEYRQAKVLIRNLEYEKFFALFMKNLDSHYDTELKALIECYKGIAINMLDIISTNDALNGKELNIDLVKILKTKLKITFSKTDRILWDKYFVILETIQIYLKT
ncbi:MAG: hypothetical protein WC222_04810 [Parachlamydiales bacterium]